MNIWNQIWNYDSYSIPELRRKKAKYKVDNFKDFLSIDYNTVCVDIGCGGGYISKEIYDRYNCCIFSCDSSSTAIEYAKQYNVFEKSHYFVSSAQKIDLPNSIADIVFCIGVLEHIEDIDSALNEIRRILKGNGKFIIVSSNCYSLIYFDRIIKQFLKKWKYGYQKNWRPSKLKSKLIENGFTIKQISIHQGYGDFKKLNKADRIISKINPFWGRYIQIVGGKND